MALMRPMVLNRHCQDFRLLWKSAFPLTFWADSCRPLTFCTDSCRRMPYSVHCRTARCLPTARTRSCCAFVPRVHPLLTPTSPILPRPHRSHLTHSLSSPHSELSQKRTLFTGRGTTSDRGWCAVRPLDVRKGVPERRVCEAWRVTPRAHLSSMASQSQLPGSGKVPELDPEDNKMRKHLHEIFLTAVEAVMPRSLLEKVIHFNPHINTLTVKERSYPVQRNVFVVGFGKGVLGMARVVEELLGDHIIRGILSIPTGAKDDYKKAGKQDMLLRQGSKISVQEGAANNLPDAQAFCTARDIHKLVSNLTPKDIVIVLMSGGGSALLPYPVASLNLEDVVKTTQELFRHGATIGDVNTVRRHLEVLKGGGLASAAMPAQVISLIISDVIGDSLELIASGPTVRQTYAPQRCLEVIDRLNARDAMPASVLKLLEEGKMKTTLQSQLTADPRGGVTESAVADKTDWSRVQNVLVGSNAIGCAAAMQCAEQLGFFTCVLTHSLSGEARKAGQMLANLAQYMSECYVAQSRTANKELVQLELDLTSRGISKNKLNEISSIAIKAHNSQRPLCVVAGGETTVNVTGTGKGGRNQEMVLAAGLQLQKAFQVYTERKAQAQVFFLSAGTDGQDGPTEAAGAIVDENFVADAACQGLDPQVFLANNDSYTLWLQFANARDHVVTGLTGTNVMDIHLIVVSTG